MAMYNKDIYQNVEKMFFELQEQVAKIVFSSASTPNAKERIIDVVSSRVAAEAEGYVIEIYTNLQEKIKKDPFFQNPEHLNSFYRLNLRESLYDQYQFNIKSLNAYKTGIQYNEINSIYKSIAESIGVSIGTASLGVLLKYTLLNGINIPIVLLIAGALGVLFYMTVGGKKQQRKDFQKAANDYLKQMKNDLFDWLSDVEIYLEGEVRKLYCQGSELE